jgi:hypothetical protein
MVIQQQIKNRIKSLKEIQHKVVKVAGLKNSGNSLERR